MQKAFDHPYLEGHTDAYGRVQCESSLISSTSSAPLSVFSDAPSLESSVASSVSDDFRLAQDDLRDGSAVRAYHDQQQQAKALVERTHYECVTRANGTAASYAEVISVPSESRKHPRRSSVAPTSQPPSLVRQSERKVNFVDNLVDSATQMVEVIWPLSVVPCNNRDATSGKGVLPLRTYIEETLRRSRTSYSTLQVALYYLILIKPFVPSRNFTMEQIMDCPADRALMCGRRMFLAALILASKYLQDRNYSAKAWSKMSGLKVNEINLNEKTFLGKVNWKLHIPEAIFKRWTDIVLRFTPNMPPPPSPPSCCRFATSPTWKCIVPLLTPELDTLPPFNEQISQDVSYSGELSSPATPLAQDSFASPKFNDAISNNATPVPATILPRYLEPKTDLVPPTPALARMGPLPTPIMTPATVASSTPAVSACSSRRSSMTSAMAFASRLGMSRCAFDQYPGQHPAAFPSFSRRPSYDVSDGSSPESMLTDRSASSRASSISSISAVSTCSSVAPARACLARQATCRNAGLPVSFREEKENSISRSKMIVTDDVDLISSPEMIDFRISDKALLTPHRHSKHAVPAAGYAASTAEKSRKRCRPRGGRRSGLQEEVRMLLEEEFDSAMDLDWTETDNSPSPVETTRTLNPYAPSKFASLEDRSPMSALSRYNSGRIVGERFEGNKRRCYASTMHMSASPVCGEVA